MIEKFAKQIMAEEGRDSPQAQKRLERQLTKFKDLVEKDCNARFEAEITALKKLNKSSDLKTNLSK